MPVSIKSKNVNITLGASLSEKLEPRSIAISDPNKTIKPITT